MAQKNSNYRNSKLQTRNLIAERIKAKMDELTREVKERRRLEKECLDSLREESNATIFELDDLMRWTLAADPVVEERRLDLENRLCRVRKEIREQKVRFWNDVQVLKGEIRGIHHHSVLLNLSYLKSGTKFKCAIRSTSLWLKRQTTRE